MAHLSELLRWSPFKLDALGLVTLLGMQSVDEGIGKLCESWCTECLPLFAGFVVATDAFRESVFGFAVFNITDGIYADDVAGWFCRWLSCVDITYNTTTLLIWTSSHRHSNTRFDSRQLLSIVTGTTAFASLVGLSVLSRDWWALANAIGLVLTVMSRRWMLQANRRSLSLSAEEGLRCSSEVVKTFWKLPAGKSVTIFVSRGVLTEALLTTPRPQSPEWYFFCRTMAWFGFLAHVISIGMAALPSQMLCVAILVASMVLLVNGVGVDESMVGSNLRIKRVDHSSKVNSMAAVFARLNLSQDEEDSMIAWKLMPHQRNIVWWRRYRNYLARDKEDANAFSTWKQASGWKDYEQLLLATDAPN